MTVSLSPLVTVVVEAFRQQSFFFFFLFFSKGGMRKMRFFFSGFRVDCLKHKAPSRLLGKRSSALIILLTIYYWYNSRCYGYIPTCSHSYDSIMDCVDFYFFEAGQHLKPQGSRPKVC